MTLDKFGQSNMRVDRNLFTEKIKKYNPDKLIQHTANGDIDVKNLEICNLKPPSSELCAANKQYVDQADNVIYMDIKSKITYLRDAIDKFKNDIEQALLKIQNNVYSKIDDKNNKLETKIKDVSSNLQSELKKLNGKMGDNKRRIDELSSIRDDVIGNVMKVYTIEGELSDYKKYLDDLMNKVNDLMNKVNLMDDSVNGNATKIDNLALDFIRKVVPILNSNLDYLSKIDIKQKLTDIESRI